MPQIIITERAFNGIKRCDRFLREHSEDTAERANLTIMKYLYKLKDSPYIGRRYIDDIDIREFVIPFGKYGYTALYKYDEVKNIIFILKFKHNRENSYK